MGLTISSLFSRLFGKKQMRILMGSLYNSSGCPGTQYIDQAGLELTEIHLPLPSKCWE